MMRALVLLLIVPPLLIAFGVASVAVNQLRHATVSTHCVEDMPCWDCSTMGNRVCGGVR